MFVVTQRQYLLVHNEILNTKHFIFIHFVKMVYICMKDQSIIHLFFVLIIFVIIYLLAKL